MASSFRKMAAAKCSRLFCSSEANVAVSFVPLGRMQAEPSIDARNWPELRTQTQKPIEEYRIALTGYISLYNEKYNLPHS